MKSFHFLRSETMFFFSTQIHIFWMLRNNVDARRCSYFELGLPVVFEVGFGQFFIFSLRYINVTLGLLPPRGHVVWRDSVGVGSSRSGLKIRVRGYFSSELYRVVAPYWQATKKAKQLSMATISLCFEFFRWPVDVLHSYFSRSTISIAVFCLQNLICLYYYFCWSGLYRSYVLLHIRLRSFAVLCG